MKSKSVMICLLLPLAIAAVSGCATHALWSESNLGAWHEPARDTALQLFRNGESRDLLVLYEEAATRHHSVRARAYLLYQNEGRVDRQRPPRFVKFDSASGWDAVPVFTNATALVTPSPPLYAILASNQLCFTLYSSGTAVGLYALPVYYDGMGKMERLALTPLTATADLTIFGGAILYYGGYAVANSPGGAEAVSDSLSSVKIRR
jgi:hypothetical protein